LLCFRAGFHQLSGKIQLALSVSKSTGKVQVKPAQTTSSINFTPLEFCWTSPYKKIKRKYILLCNYIDK